MRLSFIISGFNEQSVKALPWKYVYELSKNLAKKGCEVQIITDGHMHNREVKEVSVSTVSRTRQPPTFSLVLDPCQVDSAVEEFSPELVWFFGDYLVGYSVRRLRNRIPMIVNVSKGFYPLTSVRLSGYLSPYFYLINSPAVKSLIRLLDQRKIVAVTAPTLTIKRSLEKCGVDGQRIVVLPMAFDKAAYQHEDTNFDKCEVRDELGLSKGDFVVTYFGPPYTRRGVNDLVHAIAVLKQKFPVRALLLLRQDERLSSPELGSIRKLCAKLSVSDRVTLVCSVLPKGRLVSYLEASDVVALPFRYVDEEPPLGLLEAMASGKPVVTTNIDSLTEVVGDNRGILVRPGNVDDLASAIHYLFKHPDNAKHMAAEGRRYVKTLKSWDELADYFINLAENLSSRS